MRNIWTIAKREYDQYFISPIAYVIAFAILLILGIDFAGYFGDAMRNSFQSFGSAPDTTRTTSLLAFLLMLTTPAITMRLISDEARTGTLELLLTAPIRDFELVIGKWLGALLYVLTLIIATLIYPIILNNFIEPGLDIPATLTAYLGVLLLAGVFIALGTGISALFKNQIASFFITFLAFLALWWLVGFPAYFIIGPAGEVFNYLNITEHFYGGFNNGVIELKNLVYYISLIALGLFTGTIAIETRRWR
jgi:ABC-2 type transport system permease protein